MSGLFLWKPRLEEYFAVWCQEGHTFVHHVLGLNVGPNTKQQVLPFLSELHVFFESEITLTCATSLVLLDLGDLLSGPFAVLLHVFEDVGSNLVVLS